MFWHEADGSVLAGTGRDFGFGTLPRRRVFYLYLRRWRLRRLHSLTFRPSLFNLHIAVQLFEGNFPRYPIDNKYTFLLGVVSLVSLEHRVRYSGTI